MQPKYTLLRSLRKRGYDIRTFEGQLSVQKKRIKTRKKVLHMYR